MPVIELATRVMLGESLADMGYGSGINKEPEMVAVKVPIFSTKKLPMVEVSLGPEMRSTGEVLGVGNDYYEALYKGFIGAEVSIPKAGSTVLLTVCDRDKEIFLPIVEKFDKMGCRFISTTGTAKFLEEHGYTVKTAKKIGEGVPNVLDIIRSGMCDLVIDIPKKGNDKESDGFKLRRTAAECSVNIMTSTDTVKALADVMEKGFNLQTVQPIAVSDIK